MLALEAAGIREIVVGAVLAALAGYFLGCLNGAVLISKYILKDDVRLHGSGNAGLTNFLRSYGKKWSAGLVLIDTLKMVAAVLLGALAGRIVLGSALVGKCWAGLFCVIGHMFPCMFEFRGGKGILSAGAMALMLNWRVAVSVWGIFILLLLLTRWVSLSSICASIAYPISVCLVYREPLCTVFVLVIALLCLWQHRSNLIRLIQGKEPKFSFPSAHSDQ